MNTERLVLDARNLDGCIDRAAEVIRGGGLVAFPTETVYGLGANALDAAAAARIYTAKGRDLNDPLIVHVADRRQLAELHTLSGPALALADAFWPGPLTLVLPRPEQVPPIISAGLDTMALRMPSHPVAQALIRRSGVPVAAPSANRFGHTSPTTAAHVLDDLDGRIDMVLDGGPTEIGIESTVLDLVHGAPRILRPGGVSRAAIEAVIGPIAPARSAGAAPADQPQVGPGLLERHYAPNAELVILPDLPALISIGLRRIAGGEKLGLLLLDNQRNACQNAFVNAAAPPHVFCLGDRADQVAHTLYAGLRALESAGASVILVTQFQAIGLGEAIADRLGRAAAKS